MKCINTHTELLFANQVSYSQYIQYVTKKLVQYCCLCESIACNYANNGVECKESKHRLRPETEQLKFAANYLVVNMLNTLVEELTFFWIYQQI